MGLLTVVNDIFGLNEPGVFNMNMSQLNTALESEHISSFNLSDSAAPMVAEIEVDYGVPAFSVLDEQVTGDVNPHTVVKAFTVLQEEYLPIDISFEAPELSLSKYVTETLNFDRRSNELDVFTFSIGSNTFKQIEVGFNGVITSKISYNAFAELPIDSIYLPMFISPDDWVAADEQLVSPVSPVSCFNLGTSTASVVDPVPGDFPNIVLAVDDLVTNLQFAEGEGIEVFLPDNPSFEFAKLDAATATVVRPITAIPDEDIIAYA